jgi:hypothetical protein
MTSHCQVLTALLSAIGPRLVSRIEDAVPVDSRAQALRLAVVPLHQDLNVIGIEDGTAPADARSGFRRLDPVSLAGDLRAVLVPHRSTFIGMGSSALKQAPAL